MRSGRSGGPAHRFEPRGITFLSEKTVVLAGVGRPEDVPPADHDASTLPTRITGSSSCSGSSRKVDHAARTLLLPQLTRAARSPAPPEQRVRVEALCRRSSQALTPVALDGRGLGTVFQPSGGVLRAGGSAGEGETTACGAMPGFRPAQPCSSSGGTRSRVTLSRGRRALFPAFGLRGRAREAVDLRRPVPRIGAFRSPLYRAARRIAGSAATPYAAVLALESGGRVGGFTYDESPPEGGARSSPASSDARPGTAVHFRRCDGRMLHAWIPGASRSVLPRVARDDGTWVVTDHDAHAWVEVWSAGTVACLIRRARARYRLAASTCSVVGLKCGCGAQAWSSWSPRRRSSPAFLTRRLLPGRPGT
jgi:hypothetical protein